MLVSSVLERGLMSIVSFFKTVHGCPSVRLYSSSILSHHISLVNNPLDRASAWEWTLSFVLAVTGWRCSFMLTQCLVVVSGDLGLHVGHTSVANFDFAPIGDLVKNGRFRESFRNYFEELSANVTFDIVTVRWIEPANISISFSFFLL